MFQSVPGQHPSEFIAKPTSDCVIAGHVGADRCHTHVDQCQRHFSQRVSFSEITDAFLLSSCKAEMNPYHLAK